MVSFLIMMGFYISIGLVFWRLKIVKRRYLEPMFMWIMIAGIATLCQPWAFFFYHYGFAILLTGTLGYIFSIHLK